MISESEKRAIKKVEEIKNMKFIITSSFYSRGAISLSIVEKEAIDIVLNLITKLQKENAEKDKQIDLMAKKIYDAYFEQVDFWIWFETAIEKNLEKDYCESIKQYVKKQVKEEGN